MQVHDGVRDQLRHVLQAIDIGPVTIRNRVLIASHSTHYNRDGRATTEMGDYYEIRARAGVGLIMSESCAVHPSAQTRPHIVRLYEQESIAGLRAINDRIHAHGARSFCQLFHPGRQFTNIVSRAPVAPSALSTSADRPHELSTAEIAELVEAFALSAEHAVRAGFDGVEVHCANGYLPEQFMSPWSNLRHDEYGGALENRLRFVVEIIAAIRRRIGHDAALGLRVNSHEYMAGGYGEDEGERICLALAGEPIDYLSIAAGVHASIHTSIPPMGTPLAPLREFCARIKAQVRVPVFTSHRVLDLVMAERLLADGAADMVSMVRGHIADGELFAKTLRGEADRVQPCVGCLQGCIDRGVPMTCLVNPGVGRSSETLSLPAARPLRIAVAGGGVAGAQAALTLAARGHAVDLYEAHPQLGGTLRLAASLPGRDEFLRLLAWQERELGVRGVTVKLNTPFPAGAAAGYDALLVATGASEHPPALDFPCAARVLGLRAALSYQPAQDETVLIVDRSDFRHLALLLARQIMERGGRAVVIALGQPVAAKLERVNKTALVAQAFYKQVRTVSFAKVLAVDAHNARVQHEGWELDIAHGGTLVVIDKPQANDSLEQAASAAAPQCKILSIGDAFSPRSSLEAMQDAHTVGHTL